MNPPSENPSVNQASAPVNDAAIDPLSKTSSEALVPAPRVAVVCPNCKATLSIRRVHIGKSVQCKQCNQVFTVPAEADTQPMPVVDHTARNGSSRSSKSDVDPRNPQSGKQDKVLLDQLGQFIAGSNELRSAYEKLQAESNELRASRNELGAQLQSATAELEVIRADLGTIASADVRRLASESAELSALVQVLRGENQDLHTKTAHHDDLISQLEKRVLELDPLQAKHDALTETVKLHEGDLCAIRDERDALVRNLSEHSNELAAVRSELVQAAQRIEQLNSDLQAACRERDKLSQQLELCQNELGVAQADLGRTSSERDGALNTVAELTNTLAERDLAIRNHHDQFDAEIGSNRQAFELAERSHLDERERLAAELAALSAKLAEHEVTIRTQHDRFDAELECNRQAFDLAERNHLDERERLAAELTALSANLAEHELTVHDQHGRYNAEIESNRQAFDLAKQSHRDERERLAAELAALRAQNHQLEDEHKTSEILCKQLQDRNDELVTLRATFESEYDTLLNAERTERRQLAEEILALRANAEETTRVAAKLLSTDSNSQAAPVALADQLETARVQAEELKFKLAQAERLHRTMADTLEAIGIRIDLPIPPRDRVQTDR
jgi:chromosome segregation ATPase